jgi:hypothetical protein
MHMLVFNKYFYKNKKSKLYFGDRVAVLNDFIALKKTYQILAVDLWWSSILFISTILNLLIFITILVIY